MRYILLAIVLILTACGFSSVKEVKLISNTFEPSDHVEVLQTWPQDRKYIAISELEVSVGDQAEDALIEKAKEIGADAIVIGEKHRHGQVEAPIDGKTTDKVILNSVRAIAIKYRP
ncbi:MAG: hypothetical protein ACU85E_10225 [Gammaproteobacteria bacterium]